MYQLSVSFLWHWYFERVYPQWKERLEYKLNCRLYRIMLDADCRKYNEESYFHGIPQGVAVYTDENGGNAGILPAAVRQFSGWCGSGRHLYPHGSDDRCVRFAGVCGKPFLCQKSGGKNETQSGMNRTKKMHCTRTIYGFFCERNMQQVAGGGFWAACHFS